MYQAQAAYELKIADYRPPNKMLALDVTYGTGRMRRGEPVSCRVTVATRQVGGMRMPMVEIGLPPGFMPSNWSLEQLLEERTIAAYSQTRDRLILYLDYLNAGQPLSFEFVGVPALAGRFTPPPHSLYPYYTPELKRYTPSRPLRIYPAVAAVPGRAESAAAVSVLRRKTGASRFVAQLASQGDDPRMSRVSKAVYAMLGMPRATKYNISIKVGTLDVRGALDKSIIARIIKRHYSQIRYCYQKELNKNPKLSGMIRIGFTISGRGTVSRSNVKGSTMKNHNVEQCVAKVVKRIMFPQPKGGGIAVVGYPFTFDREVSGFAY